VSRKKGGGGGRQKRSFGSGKGGGPKRKPEGKAYAVRQKRKVGDEKPSKGKWKEDQRSPRSHGGRPKRGKKRITIRGKIQPEGPKRETAKKNH